MNDIGEFTLMVALATSLYGVVAYVMSARGNRIDLYLALGGEFEQPQTTSEPR